MVTATQTAPASETAPTAAASACEAPATRRILYCHCAHARVVPKDVKAEVLAGLAESGIAFDAVPDLCELAARRDPSLERLVQLGGDDGAASGELDIVACYPRAVRWLFHAADAPLPDEGVRIHNMRADTAEDLLPRAIEGRPAPAPETEDDSESEAENESSASSEEESA